MLIVLFWYSSYDKTHTSKAYPRLRSASPSFAGAPIKIIVSTLLNHHNQDNTVFTILNHPSSYDKTLTSKAHPGSAQLRRGPNQDDIVFILLNHPSNDKTLPSKAYPGSAQLRRGTNHDNIVFTLPNHTSYDMTITKAYPLALKRWIDCSSVLYVLL